MFYQKIRVSFLGRFEGLTLSYFLTSINCSRSVDCNKDRKSVSIYAKAIGKAVEKAKWSRNGAISLKPDVEKKIGENYYASVSQSFF